MSLKDPDGRPICKGKLARRTEFGYVQQICEVTENSRGSRGNIVAPSTGRGNPGENDLPPATLASLDALGFTITELALDGGFRVTATSEAIAASAQDPDTVAIAGSQEADSPRTQRRLYCGLRRSRLKGHQGQRTWCGWGILAYNLDTRAIRAG